MTDKELEQKAEEYVRETLMLNEELDPTFRAMTEAYIAGYEATEWHYCKDEIPKDESDVLCWLGKDMSVVGYCQQKTQDFYSIDGEQIEPIAWQEIRYPEGGKNDRKALF